MKVYSEYFIRYSFTCPSGHTEIRGEIVSAIGSVEAAEKVMKGQFVCGHCKADSRTSKFLVRVLLNEPLPPPKK